MKNKNPGLGARRVTVEAALAASKAGPTSTADDSKKVVPLSVRLPKDVHEQLRRIAFEDRVSIHSIVIAALEKELAERHRK